jgi:hypothetical protein
MQKSTDLNNVMALRMYDVSALRVMEYIISGYYTSNCSCYEIKKGKRDHPSIFHGLQNYLTGDNKFLVSG